jgi:hypothetical protein
MMVAIAAAAAGGALRVRVGVAEIGHDERSVADQGSQQSHHQNTQRWALEPARHLEEQRLKTAVHHHVGHRVDFANLVQVRQHGHLFCYREGFCCEGFVDLGQVSLKLWRVLLIPQARHFTELELSKRQSVRLKRRRLNHFNGPVENDGPHCQVRSTYEQGSHRATPADFFFPRPQLTITAYLPSTSYAAAAAVVTYLNTAAAAMLFAASSTIGVFTTMDFGF